jgi:signal transduction histidine kinase
MPNKEILRMNSSAKQGIEKLPTRKHPSIKRAKTMHQLLVQERAAREAAEDTVKATADFFTVVMHELRSPLSAIIGWSRVLRTTKADEPNFPHALEVIERNAKVQGRLINELLDLAGIPRGSLYLELQQVDVAPIIEDALEGIRPSAEAKGIELRTIFGPQIGAVKADPQRLEQILWNLLWNAVKFTQRGGCIEVRLERAGQQVEIAVSDTGQGISADFLPHVFDHLRQARSVSQGGYSGLGLGLALVRSLVEMHGGTVSAESQGEGLGATFTIQLPMRIEDGRYEEVK